MSSTWQELSQAGTLRAAGSCLGLIVTVRLWRRLRPAAWLAKLVRRG